MVLTITEENKASVEDAFQFSIALLADRVSRGAEGAHPDRRDIGWWKQLEKDIARIKTLRGLLEQMEQATKQDKGE